jgi:hypothetical protein
MVIQLPFCQSSASPSPSLKALAIRECSLSCSLAVNFVVVNVCSHLQFYMHDTLQIAGIADSESLSCGIRRYI